MVYFSVFFLVQFQISAQIFLMDEDYEMTHSFSVGEHVVERRGFQGTVAWLVAWFEV